MSMQDAPPPERFALPMPDDFDIRNLPNSRTTQPLIPPRPQAPNEENYRVQSYSIPCENGAQAGRLLQETLQPDEREALNRALNTCRSGSRIDLDIYHDDAVRVSPQGIGRIRLRITIPNSR